MKTQGTQGPETFEDRINAIFNDAYKYQPRNPVPYDFPVDFERGLPPPYGSGRPERNSGMEGLFGVQPQHLQQMAGELIQLPPPTSLMNSINARSPNAAGLNTLMRQYTPLTTDRVPPNVVPGPGLNK